MFAKYGLKIVEYSFYALAAVAALQTLEIGWIKRGTPTDVAGIVFILTGIGVLLPRAIAYLRWQRVTASIGPYSDTWDGEQSATYAYEFGGQRYLGTFRTMYGTTQRIRVQVCVNPHAPRIRYVVFWNVWLFGAAMLGVGLFLLISDQNYFG